jgi:hypothetical protein
MDHDSGMYRQQGQGFGTKIGAEQMEVENVVMLPSQHADKFRHIPWRKFPGRKTADIHPDVPEGLLKDSSSMHASHLRQIMFTVKMSAKTEQKGLSTPEIKTVDHMENFPRR